MQYISKCRKCGEETEVALTKFNPDEEQTYIFKCGNCGKKTERTFPLDFEIDRFYKLLRGRARLVFRKYVLEKKSFRQTSKELGIPLTTCYKSYTKEIGMGARNYKQSLKNYYRQKKRRKTK